MKIVIAAASGNIGRRIIEKVIQAGAETILLTRHPEKLADFVTQGAIIQQVSSDDAQRLIEITQQADALFWLTPPKLDVSNLSDWYLQTAKAGANAVSANGIARVVNISSIGAGAKPNLGTVSLSGNVESIFNQTAANVVHLRPGYFMENFLVQIETLQSDPTVRFSYPSDHDIPWISTDDIGDVAAHYLLNQRWAGQWTRNLMGPENLTLLETSAILSRVLGYSIEYTQVSIESLQQQFAAMGATAEVQREMGDLFRALGDPDGVYATARTPEAKTPTTFEQFVKNKILPNLVSLSSKVIIPNCGNSDRRKGTSSSTAVAFTSPEQTYITS
ncbi:NAD(P)H-binding protein [Nostoc sp. FACHB-888]|uniref:NmrA family NAD(P)-binding protein n=1 Tax=Nostoc sp. FACHB-888 TaxID=2692842 RepID=UPI001681DC3C|nr:NAD(P)H-binding protein [Nostoc sp. FACHB-888]MBD2247385.1 NmrA family NAD(P)-binding protein [Nostoc sp. FACHB-888]